MSHSPSSLAAFAEVGDRLARETSKLAKAALLGAYIKTLPDDDDLRRGVWYSSGRTFATTDERVTGVSSAAVRNAVLDVTNLDPGRWRELTISAGEAGEALAAAWSAPPPPTAPLTLADLGQAFDQLALHGEARRKRSILTGLLRRLHSAREAAYLLKILFGDLRTGVQDGIVLDAIARATDTTTKDLRQALLLEGDLGEVAVLARVGRLAQAHFALFRPLSFMLAAVVASPEEAVKQIKDRAFIAEDKLDGIRAQIHRTSSRVAIYTRTLDNIAESFPDVVRQVQSLEGDLLLDGEIVPWHNGQALPFAHIQRRMGRKKPSAAVIQQNPVTFIAFDLLFADGKPWLDQPLSARRARLAQFPTLPRLDAVEIPSGTPDAIPRIEVAFAASRARRNEGILLKDLASPYLPGRRGQVWYKLKSHLPTLDCVVTAAEHGNGKRRNHLSDYTFAVWTEDPTSPTPPAATLVNIGKAYIGVTDEEIETLTKLFKEISTSFDGRVYQVRPQVVMEIAFDAIQSSARHASGYALRFPRIARIRHDKRPEDADTLQRVREVFLSSDNLNRADQPADVPPLPPQAEPSLFDNLP